jgi:hypothetical protein
LKIIDEKMIIKLDNDGSVKVVDGRKLNWKYNVGGYDKEMEKNDKLVMKKSIDFGKYGEMYVDESE